MSKVFEEWTLNICPKIQRPQDAGSWLLLFQLCHLWLHQSHPNISYQGHGPPCHSHCICSIGMRFAKGFSILFVAWFTKSRDNTGSFKGGATCWNFSACNFCFRLKRDSFLLSSVLSCSWQVALINLKMVFTSSVWVLGIEQAVWQSGKS